MTTDFIAAAPRAETELKSKNVIAVNAEKVLETTRHAWSEARVQAPEPATRRSPRAAQKKRVVARRSRWPSLIAALNYWSPKPL